MQVNQELPDCGWVKCTNDGKTAMDDSLDAACSGIFCDCTVAMMSCFSISLDRHKC